MVLELPKALIRRQPLLLAIQLMVMVVNRDQVDSQLDATSTQRALDRLEGRLHCSRLPPSDGRLAGVQPSRQFSLGQSRTPAPLPDETSTLHPLARMISVLISGDRGRFARATRMPAPESKLAIEAKKDGEALIGRKGEQTKDLGMRVRYEHRTVPLRPWSTNGEAGNRQV